MTTGTGVFFDGRTSARRDVAVEAAPEALRVRGPDGGLLAEWSYPELTAFSAPAEVLRLGRKRDTLLARLEIHDAALAAKIDEYAHGIDRSGATERRSRHKVIAWTFAATVSLVFVAVVGLPALIAHTAPFIPMSVEQKLGTAVDGQVRAMLNTDKTKVFECGAAGSETAGRAALDRLVGRLEQAAALPIPIRTAVVRRSEANAIALPGGHVYVFDGLVKQSRTPDELAGVIAHEIGHVAHRDGTRSILQAAGLSFLFGMLLGDFTGGGLVVIAAKAIVQSAYSRDVESAADRYAVELVERIGGDGRALGAILARIAGGSSGMTALSEHPATKERVALIDAIASRRSSTPLLTAAEWADLKRVCG